MAVKSIIQSVYEEVLKRNHGEVEFHQAVKEVLDSLEPVLEKHPEYIEAKRLLAFLEWFLPLDVNLVPDNSLLREFLGGSILKDFTVWREG